MSPNLQVLFFSQVVCQWSLYKSDGFSMVQKNVSLALAQIDCHSSPDKLKTILNFTCILFWTVFFFFMVNASISRSFWSCLSVAPWRLTEIHADVWQSWRSWHFVFFCEIEPLFDCRWKAACKKGKNLGLPSLILGSLSWHPQIQ